MAGRPPGLRLTTREREIAKLIGLGLTNKEIAIRLNIAQRTADAHVQNMLNKLSASNRAQIVALAADPSAEPEAAATLAEAMSTASALPPPTRVRASTRFGVMLIGILILPLLMPADQRIDHVNGASEEQATGTYDRGIVDAFTDTDLDTSIWDVDSSDRVYIYEGSGHLAMYVAAGAADNFNGALSTVCRAHGDFDARVSFQLITWHDGDGVDVSLIASGTPFNTYRTSATRPDSYGAYLPPAGREVKAIGTTGILRLTRTGAKWSGYYHTGERWSWIASGEGPTSDVGLGIALFNPAQSRQFGGREALVYLTRFQLAADRIVCA